MMPFDSGRRYVEATRGGCRSEVPASSDVRQVHLNASSDRVAQVQSRLLRRHAPNKKTGHFLAIIRKGIGLFSSRAGRPQAGGKLAMTSIVIASPRVRASRGPRTGSAKQSRRRIRQLDSRRGHRCHALAHAYAAVEGE